MSLRRLNELWADVLSRERWIQLLWLALAGLGLSLAGAEQASLAVTVGVVVPPTAGALLVALPRWLSEVTAR